MQSKLSYRIGCLDGYVVWQIVQNKYLRKSKEQKRKNNNKKMENFTKNLFYTY